MPDSSEDAALARCLDADPLVNLSLYADLLDSSPFEASLPALALRDQARAGLVGEDLIPILAVAAVDAPTLATFIHLAKALAAFGARARSTAPLVIERLDAIQVTNDRRFWALDSGLWVLAHLGGDAARAWIKSLQAEAVPRALRSKSVYRGGIPDDERAMIFAETLAATWAASAVDSPGWTQKSTSLVLATDDDKAAPRVAPWMTR
jgi:hypothetical protein